ncbi:hypothetical protein C0991_002455 [Blastosporella zonata]|nr:hypothetical protein C0991_002455 [Blastosporella zonata]
MDRGQLVPRPGTFIQHAADLLVDIITAERRDTARAAQHRYQELEQHFATYRENANAAVAAEQARFSDAHQKLIAAQALLAQYQRMEAYGARLPNSTTQLHPGQRQILPPDYVSQKQARDAELLRTAQSEASSATQRLEELQNALRDVGITFSSEDNSLIFEAGWAVVLAHLEARDFGVMNARRLHEVLGQLTHRLQHDRKTIEQLEQRVQALDAEKTELIDKYELELQLSQLGLAILQDAAANQVSNSSPAITTTPAEASTRVVSDAPPGATPTDLIRRCDAVP